MFENDDFLDGCIIIGKTVNLDHAEKRIFDDIAKNSEEELKESIPDEHADESEEATGEDKG